MSEDITNLESKQRPYLLAVQLLNCQSHENTVYEFAVDKINIIKAPNNTGKSVLFKMLAITVDPKSIPVEKRKQLISYGTQSARVGYSFSDGTMGYCEVWPSQVIYYWRDVGEEQFVTSYVPPEELIWRLSVLADEKEHSIANLIDNDQNLLLVDSDEKANHKLLKIVTENERLNTLKETLTKKYNDYTDISANLNSKLRLVEYQMENLSKIDVNKLQHEIRELEALYNVTYSITDMLAELDVISSSCVKKREFTSLFKLISVLTKIIKLRETLDKIQISKRVTAESIQLTETIIMLVKSIRDVNSIIPVDTERLINTLKLLSALEALNPTNLIPQKNEHNLKSKVLLSIEDFHSMLEHIKGIAVQDTGVLQALDFIPVIQQLTQIEMLVQSLAHLKVLNNSLESSIAESVSMLQANNAIVECGVYGKAIFDGKECSPLGE